MQILRPAVLRLVFTLAASMLAMATAQAGLADDFATLASKAVGASSASAGAGAQIDVGFSPEGSAEALVLKVVESARRQIRLQAYAFTLPSLTRALIDAHKRGVDVALAVDKSQNIAKDNAAKAQAALSAMVTAGITVRVVSVYPAMHDKFIVVDGQTLQTGSFNYSTAAARRNSENVIVLWNAPDLARRYLDHWDSRFAQGVPYSAGY